MFSLNDGKIIFQGLVGISYHEERQLKTP